MEACWAVAYLTLDIGQMGCFLDAYKSPRLTIPRGMAGKTLLIVFSASHFQYPEVPGALESAICFYE